MSATKPLNLTPFDYHNIVTLHDKEWHEIISMEGDAITYTLEPVDHPRTNTDGPKPYFASFDGNNHPTGNSFPREIDVPEPEILREMYANCTKRTA